MKFLQEITVWKNDTPNHLYVVNDVKSKMIAYRPVGKDEFYTFKTPKLFDTKGRKFIEIRNKFGYKLAEVTQADEVWDIVGSKGDVYVVERTGNDYICSCSGFKFRSKCKHVESMQKATK